MNNKRYLKDILNMIIVLQNNAEKTNCDNSCSRAFLGNPINIECFNTRLVTFYRCDNTLISLPYNDLQTTVFRIESVKDNTVNVLLLSLNEDGTYTSTNTYAAINLKCICAIRCIGDTTINNV